MATGIYVGVGGVPRKLTGSYVGIGDVPRKVKEIYVGVGGVPKLVWRNALTYSGDLTIINYTSGKTDIYGTLKGEYNVTVNGDTAHVVGTATVTGFEGSTVKNAYFYLPYSTTSGTKYGAVKVYSKEQDRIIATYDTDYGDASFINRRGTDGVSYPTLKAYNSTGFDYIGNRKIEIEFDYYTLSSNIT